MGTQLAPTRQAPPTVLTGPRPLGQASHQGVGTRGCCSCGRCYLCSLSMCHTSTADPYTLRRGRRTLRAHRDLEAEGAWQCPGTCLWPPHCLHGVLTKVQSPSSFARRHPIPPTHTHLGAPTFGGIEGPVGGREAPTADATVCPKEHHQLAVRGDKARRWLSSTEPAQGGEQTWAGGPWPTRGVFPRASL